MSTARSDGTTNDSESAVWPGVATTCSSRSPTATTSPSPRPSEPSRYAGSSARTPQPDPLGELAGRLGVVGVVVGEQHRGHGPAAASIAARCASIDGPGSTTTERSPSGARSTQVLVPSRVIMLALGASTHSATSPNRPPVQLIRRCRPITGSRWAGRESVTSSPVPVSSGVNISTTRSAAATSTASGSAYSDDLEAGQVGRRQHEDPVLVDRGHRVSGAAAR